MSTIPITIFNIGKIFNIKEKELIHRIESGELNCSKSIRLRGNKKSRYINAMDAKLLIYELLKEVK